MKKKIELKEWQIRWLGIPLVAFVGGLMPGDHHMKHGLLITFLHSCLFTAVYWNGAAAIIYFFRKKYPEISETGRRMSWTLPLLTFFVFVAGAPVKVLLGYATWTDLLILNTYIEYGFFSAMMTVLIGGLYEAVYFFEKWRETFRLTEELKSQQLKTQFAVLQNQMSPHFLFNSLNTLTTLIAENQDTAIQFTQKLSEVYRYILSHKDRELVSLHEELEFARSYVFLLQMRYPDNLHIDFNLGQEYLNTHIAPLTLQMLIENAIKHNEVSRKKPLTITIYIEDGQSIIVENNLQVKSSLGESTKTGLSNIRKRYHYLADREIEIVNSGNIFKVSVPIIRMVNKELVLNS